MIYVSFFAMHDYSSYMITLSRFAKMVCVRVKIPTTKMGFRIKPIRISFARRVLLGTYLVQIWLSFRTEISVKKRYFVDWVDLVNISVQNTSENSKNAMPKYFQLPWLTQWPFNHVNGIPWLFMNKAKNEWDFNGKSQNPIKWRKRSFTRTSAFWSEKSSKEKALNY